MNKNEMNTICKFLKFLAENKQDWSDIQKESYKLLVDCVNAGYKEEKF